MENVLRAATTPRIVVGRLYRFSTPLLLALAAMQAVAATLSLLGDLWWFADLAASGRMYYLAAAALGIAIAMLQRRWAVALIIAASATPHALAVHAVDKAQAATVRPHPAGAIASTAGATPARRLRVVSVNLFLYNPTQQRAVGFIRRASPDIAILQEVRDRWDASIAALQEQLPYRYPRLGTKADVVILSKHPIINGGVRWPNERFAPIVRATIFVRGLGRVQVLGIHAGHPFPSRSWRTQSIYLSRIATLTNRARALGIPTIVAGDFNLTAWSRRFARMQSDGRLKLVGLPPFAATWSPGFMHGRYDWRRLVRAPIDHILVGGDIRVVNARIGPEIGSDHRPVAADLLLSGH